MTDIEFDVELEEPTMLEADFEYIPVGVITPKSYNDLADIPTLNGIPIRGDMKEMDPTVPNWAKQPKKPVYSADEVGAIPAGAKLGAADLEYMWDTTEI